jgi:hypothetical protein
MEKIIRLCCILCLLRLGLAETCAAPTNSLRVTVELWDGSRVVGQGGDAKLEFHSAILGELKLPLEQISSVECQPKTNFAKLITANGDKLSVAFATKEIRVKTSFGEVKLAVDSIRRLQVSVAGMSGRPRLGLVALWSGEGNADDSVSGCNGQLINGVGFVSGKVGQAFELNEGINAGFATGYGGGFPGGRFVRGGSYVLIPSSQNLDVGKGDGFTIECWIKPITVTKQQLIAEYERFLGTADGADVGIDFAIQASSMLNANVVDASDSHASHEIYAPANLLTAGIWQHIALTYDKPSGTAAIYINGTVVAQANLGSFTPQTSFGNLLLGARTTYGSASSPNTLFSGGMDEIGIYNRALSAAEIQAICTEENNGDPLPPPTATPRRMPSNGPGQNFISQ